MEPAATSCSTVVSKGFMSIAASPQIVDAEPVQQKNAGDELCINDPGKPALSWVNLEMLFCNIDPDGFSMMTGDPVVLDDAVTPNSVGVAMDTETSGTAHFALEVWTDVAKQQCTTTTKRYGYHLFPHVGNGMWGDFTFENGAINFTINAQTIPGNAWGVGPYDVINDVLLAPSPLLTALSTTIPYHGQITTLAPPTEACGCTALVIP